MRHPSMILLFTSRHCTWCETLKTMIETESSQFRHRPVVCEIRIDEHDIFAKVFGISVVPTLIYRNSILTGLPDSDDLRSFLIRAIAEGCSLSSSRDSDAENAEWLPHASAPDPTCGRRATGAERNSELTKTV
ncbi:MAG: hypothetical protein DRO73_02875 [Candidatus Thorarchaeota archaeon]|nr:MAG: hypothetical protein DRO73_02875 [Candidatus Thorarchaeota archaeon]